MVDTTQKRVLIVDDEPHLLELVGFWFEFKGFKVTSVANGKNAQQHLQESSFDIIVLDLMIPNINGKQLLSWLRKEQKATTPVIITTGLNRPELKAELEELGANRLLTKPVQLPDLEKTLKELLLL